MNLITNIILIQSTLSKNINLHADIKIVHFGKNKIIYKGKSNVIKICSTKYNHSNN